MARRRLLQLAPLFVLFGLYAIQLSAVPAYADSIFDNWGNGAESKEDRVTVWSQYTGGQTGAAAVENAVDGLGRKLTAAEMADLLYWIAIRERLASEPTCASYGTCDPRPVTSDVIASNTQVTLRDIAAFVPHSPGAASEPADWTIVGVPTNFYLSASQRIIVGTLLGQRAEVRFTPASSHWEHSDGAVVDANTIGASWAQLGQAELTATATSHVYTSAGNYVIHSSIGYTAEYRLNGGNWMRITGIVRATAPDLQLRAYGANTVLVDRTCQESPPGPGC